MVLHFSEKIGTTFIHVTPFLLLVLFIYFFIFSPFDKCRLKLIQLVLWVVK